MIVTKILPNDINKTIKKINKKYDNNIKTDSSLDCICNIYPKYKINLLIKDFNEAGARIGLINKPNKLACWHTYYDFFNILLEINPRAVIYLYGDWIIKKTSDDKILGNLDKINKNSAYYVHKPKLSSFLCRCKQNT